MKTVLVAGGAGFIGSHLCARLLDEGYRVICADNLLTGAVKNVEELRKNSQFIFVDWDVTQPLESLQESVFIVQDEKVDFVFHLASPASPNAKSLRSYVAFPLETLKVNSLGTGNLLELARAWNARFLYASTSEVYGNPSVSPQPETYWGNVNPNGVRSVYDEGKRFGEAMTMAYVRKFALDARIARIFNTYGPNMQMDDGRVVSNFINQALKNEPLTVYGDGRQTRSFCYVSDLVDGLRRLMFTEGLKGEVLNVGNLNETSILEFARVVKEWTGAASDIVFENLPQDDPMQRCPDINKAKKLLGWKPLIGLEEGIMRTVKYFKNAISL